MFAYKCPLQMSDSKVACVHLDRFAMSVPLQLIWSKRNSHSHTHTHTHTHTQHTQTHTNTTHHRHTHTHSHTHTPPHTHTYTHARAHAFANLGPCTYSRRGCGYKTTPVA